jgi:hypothetical protein
MSKLPPNLPKLGLLPVNLPFSYPYKNVAEKAFIIFQLKQLKLEHFKIETLGFFELSGGYKMQIKPYSDKNTNGLTAAVCAWLTYTRPLGLNKIMIKREDGSSEGMRVA